MKKSGTPRDSGGGGGGVATLGDLGVTASAAELNFVDGVTSAVQTQLDLKQSANYLAHADPAVTLVNGTSAQPIFTSAADTLTVVSDTTYRFRMVLTLNTGATSCNVTFTFGGTATFTFCSYMYHATRGAAGSAGSLLTAHSATAGATVVVGSGTETQKRLHMEGTFRINVGGTVIPQITFNVDPTGTITAARGSFFEAYPVGTGAVTAVGPWA